MKKITYNLELTCKCRYSAKCQGTTRFLEGESPKALTTQARQIGWKIGVKVKCPDCVSALKY